MGADSPDQITESARLLRTAFELDPDEIGWVIEVKPGYATLTHRHGRALAEQITRPADPPTGPRD